MTHQTPNDHEKLTYQYTVALDEGDMDIVARILVQAEHDPELERMILEVNDALLADDSYQTQPTEQDSHTMPVFTPTKHKSGTQLRWTAVAAIVASILFVRFALFVATDTVVDSYSAESTANEAPEFFALPPDDFDTSIYTQSINLNEDSITDLSLRIDAGHAELRIGSVSDSILQADIVNVGPFDYQETGNSNK